MTNFDISSRSHYGLYLGPTKECDFVEWMIWALDERNVNQLWLEYIAKIKFRFKSRFLDSRVESKSKNWDSHSFSNNGMWISKISGTCSKCIGMGISVGSKIGSKSSKDTEVNIDSKFEIESQNGRSSSRSCSNSISLKWKLVNLSMVWYLSSSIWYDEIESWLMFPRYHDSWLLSI